MKLQPEGLQHTASTSRASAELAGESHLTMKLDGITEPDLGSLQAF